MRCTAASGSVFRSTATDRKRVCSDTLAVQQHQRALGPRLRKSAYDAAPLVPLTEPDVTAPFELWF